jgi:uncharacterized protein (TIGR02001 family)
MANQTKLENKNVMKKTAIIAAALAIAATAQAQDAKKSYSVTTDFSYTSEYVFRGIEQQDKAFQPSVEVTAGDAYLGLWTSQAITHQDSSFAKGNEIDVYGGYKYKVNNSLTLEAVGTYYLYPSSRARFGETGHSLEAGIGATYNINGFTPAVNYYYDFVLDAQTTQVSVGYSYPLTEIGTSLDFNVFAGHVDSRDVNGTRPGKAREAYDYYGADLSVPYKLSETATATAALHWVDNRNVPAGTAGDNLYYTLGVSVGF